MVRPWSPIWVVAAMATSSTRSGGSSGLRRSSSRMQRTTRSSARVSAYMPFGPALPNGVRTPSTKTTSRNERDMGLLQECGAGSDRARHPSSYPPVTHRRARGVPTSGSAARSGAQAVTASASVSRSRRQLDLPLAGAAGPQRLGDRSSASRGSGGLHTSRRTQVRGDQVLRRHGVLRRELGQRPRGGLQPRARPGRGRPTGAAAAARRRAAVRGSSSSGSGAAAGERRRARCATSRRSRGRRRPAARAAPPSFFGSAWAAATIAESGSTRPGATSRRRAISSRACHSARSMPSCRRLRSPWMPGGAAPRVGLRRRAGRRRGSPRTPGAAHSVLPCSSRIAASASRRSTSTSTSSAA